MPDPARAATLIKRDDRFLIIQEAAGQVKGLWNWSQGAVEEGESPEEAAIREAKEETGLDIELERKLGVVENPFSNTSAIHIFLGRVIGGELSLQEEEILEAKWLTLSEIEKMEEVLVGPWILEMVKREAA